jgi:hypothetical protein
MPISPELRDARRRIEQQLEDTLEPERLKEIIDQALSVTRKARATDGQVCPAEMDRLAPKIGELIQASPRLVPTEVHTSPSQLEQSLEAVGPSREAEAG